MMNHCRTQVRRGEGYNFWCLEHNKPALYGPVAGSNFPVCHIHEEKKCCFENSEKSEESISDILRSLSELCAEASTAFLKLAERLEEK